MERFARRKYCAFAGVTADIRVSLPSGLASSHGEPSSFQECPVLNLLGPSSRFCDGVNRRSFLQIGSLAVGGLTLPTLLKADGTTPTRRRSNKSVIMVYLSGGMSHHDTFDMKPD